MVNPIQSLGAYALRQVSSAGRLGLFFIYTIRGIILPPGKFWPTVKQIEFIGTKSFLVIGFTAAFTGMVLALQGYHTLTKFGSEGWLGSAVGLSLIRELGPVLSALMVTGRAGSAIAAEIGIMRIEEQIDALECMAIDPFSYLITPRFIASVDCSAAPYRVLRRCRNPGRLCHRGGFIGSKCGGFLGWTYFQR